MIDLETVNRYIRWDAEKRLFAPRFFQRSKLPTWLYFNPLAANPFVVNAAAGATTPAGTYRTLYSSNQGFDEKLGTPFLVKQISFADSTDTTALANWTVFMEDLGEARRFMNRDIHVRTFMGTAQNPCKLREPYMFPSNQTILTRLNKVAGGAVNTRIYLEGITYYPWSSDLEDEPEEKSELLKEIDYWFERRKAIWPYWLTTDTPVVLAGNQQLDFFSKIGDDGHFEMFALAAVSTGNFSLELSEVKTKQTLMEGTITQTNGIGTNTFPTLLPIPYLIPAGYTLRWRFTDLTGAANTIHITAQGRKIYSALKGAEKESDLLSIKRIPVEYRTVRTA